MNNQPHLLNVCPSPLTVQGKGRRNDFVSLQGPTNHHNNQNLVDWAELRKNDNSSNTVSESRLSKPVRWRGSLILAELEFYLGVSIKLSQFWLMSKSSAHYLSVNQGSEQIATAIKRSSDKDKFHMNVTDWSSASKYIQNEYSSYFNWAL